MPATVTGFCDGRLDYLEDLGPVVDHFTNLTDDSPAKTSQRHETDTNGNCSTGFHLAGKFDVDSLERYETPSWLQRQTPGITGNQVHTAKDGRGT